MGRLLRRKVENTPLSTTTDSCSSNKRIKTAVPNRTNKIKETNKPKKGSLKINCLCMDSNDENVDVNNTNSQHKCCKNVKKKAVTAKINKIGLDFEDGLSGGSMNTNPNVNDKTKTNNLAKNFVIDSDEEQNKVTNLKNKESSDLSSRVKRDLEKKKPASRKCDSEFDKENITRSILMDKTNSLMKNNISQVGDKRKIHFSSKNNVRRITQRRISDFFHNQNVCHLQEIPNVNSSITNESDKNALNKSVEELDKAVNQKILEKSLNGKTDLSKTVVHDHVPVYKQPVINGRKSFCLTPPQVENKEKLYDFEVDENEEPRAIKKKRRPIKTYKKRKRLCVKNIGMSNELDNIPQRTIKLRTDHLVSADNNRIVAKPAEDIIEIDKPTSEPIIEKSSKQTLQSGGNELSCNVSSLNRSQKQSNDICKVKSNRPVKSGSSHLEEMNVTKSKQNLDVFHDISNKENHDASSGLPAHFDQSHLKANNISNLEGTSKIKEKSGILVNISQGNKPSDDLSNYTSGFHSPLPEYSRINEGIQVGPVYASSSINCSDSDFANNFMRGVTASTPFRQLNSPIVKPNFQVRLSGGEALNKYHPHVLIESDSESEEEFFGFRVNDNHDDSLCDININKTPKKQTRTVENEPVQKVSVKEVINILLKDVGSDTEKNKIKPCMLKPLFNNSLSPGSRSVDETNADDYLNDPYENTQQIIDHFFSKDKENTKNKEPKVQIEEPNESLPKQPRRSYTNTPRKKKVVNFGEVEDHSECEEEEEIKKKPQKRICKFSKKEEKEMDKLAAKMNSQFQQVEKFELLVE